MLQLSYNQKNNWIILEGVDDMELIRKQLNNGINLYIDTTDKFKTVTINLYIHNQLGEEATKYALLPAVLKRGTFSIKTYKEMVKFLENLYGTTMAVSVYKKRRKAPSTI